MIDYPDTALERALEAVLDRYGLPGDALQPVDPATTKPTADG